MEKKTHLHVDPHNAFLYTGCEYGVIGLIVFLAMLGNIFNQAKRIWADDSYPVIYQTYALGMAGFIVCLIVCNMVYANFYKDLVIGTNAILIGMLSFVIAQKKCEK